MSYIYVTKPGCVIGSEKNRITIKNHDEGLLQTVPIETVDGIVMLGISQISTKCIEDCLKRGISVSFCSQGGRYFGRLLSTGHVRTALQRKQAILYDTTFALDLGKEILGAKIRNQQVVLRRYASRQQLDVSNQIRQMRICEKKIEGCYNISSMMGYEGQGAKCYFEGMSICIDPAFRFHGRNRRPPKDEFNALISLGYSRLMNEVLMELEAHGLNPYFGFLHRDGEYHPTLASDLMEEWRAVLVDATAMSMLNGHEMQKEDFRMSERGCLLTREGLRKFLGKLERKMNTRVSYFAEAKPKISFRTGLSMQISTLIKAMEMEDASLYQPLRIR